MQLSAELFRQIILGLHSDEATSQRHEKRREGRVGVRCSIDVTPLVFGDHGPKSIRVTVRDISSSGLGLISHMPLETGVDLICKLPGYDQTKIELPMKIRHCIQVSKGIYSIGASFDRKPFMPTKGAEVKHSDVVGTHSG